MFFFDKLHTLVNFQKEPTEGLISRGNNYLNCVLPLNYRSFEFYDFTSKSELLFFFKSLNLCTPESQNKVESFDRTRFKSKISRLNSYFFRHGKKIKFFNYLLVWYFRFYNKKKKYFLKEKKMFDWKSMYHTLYFFFSSKLNIYNRSLSAINPVFSNSYLNKNLVGGELWDLGNVFYKKFSAINIIFSFYVYKVDKHLYKNSRGRSGKFTLVWKYVPFFKRYSLISHWLIKEIRVSPGKNLTQRLEHVFNLFLNDTTNTWIFQMKRFSLFYAFHNLRKSLGETYKMSMRTK